MRLVTLLFFMSFLTLAFAQDGQPSGRQQDRVSIPTSLEEAHSDLERMLPRKELAKIDAMRSEDDMAIYHFGLGMWIRNNWGLWAGSPLADHMKALGFFHPDDMSAVILATFWCKRHGKDFRLKERAEKYARYWQAARKAAEDEKNRVARVKLAMQAMMMGLHFDKRVSAEVRMPDRADSELRARFLAPFRNGVFVAVRRMRDWRKYDSFITEGYYYDRADHKIHKIHVKELGEVYSAVLVGGMAWFAGVTDGKALLVGVNEQHRVMVELPQQGDPPLLGLDGQELLAVYPKAVYRLSGRKWTLVYAGDIALPRSGPPPELRGSILYLRDEGHGENEKRLWWIDLEKKGARPVSLDEDVKVVGPEGPRWEYSSSHCVTSAGDLWATVGEDGARKSLLRRTRDGHYSIAIMNNSVTYTPDLFGSEDTDEGLSVSAVAVLPHDAILLIGNAGLYRLNGDRLVQELAFTNTQQKIPINNGKNVYHWGWFPSNVVVLGDQSYVISGEYGGIYLLSQGEGGKWSFLSLDEHVGEVREW